MVLSPLVDGRDLRQNLYALSDCDVLTGLVSDNATLNLSMMLCCQCIECDHFFLNDRLTSHHNLLVDKLLGPFCL